MAARKKKTETVTTKKTGFSVGDKVVLKNDHHCLCWDFLAGIEVVIVEVTKRGYDISDNPENPTEGHIMTECGWEL